MVGITRQNEPVGKGFGVNGVEIAHGRRVCRLVEKLNEKTPEKRRGFLNSCWNDKSCAGRNRTYDLQVMSLAS